MNTKRFYFIGFFIIILFTVSCNKNKLEHEVWIYNGTNDTVDCNLGETGLFEVNKFSLSPFERKLVNIDKKRSIFDILNDENITSVSFYNQKTTVIWKPPLQDESHKGHDFFYVNSWIMDNTYHNTLFKSKEYVIATFTITDYDFK